VRCPFCDSEDTQVLDTRVSHEGDSIRRRRRCPDCDKRFNTFERIELTLPAVVKKNGSRTDFDRRKVRASMSLALRKRPVSAEAVDSALGRIEEKLMSLAQREVNSDIVGELVMRELRKLDKVAYVRFASVYRSFEDVSSFADFILEVAPSQSKSSGKSPAGKIAKGVVKVKGAPAKKVTTLPAKLNRSKKPV
jgi:transcriptional repressor NrdR